MPSLLGSTVALNYLKTKPSTQLGTRQLRMIKITVNNGGSVTVDMTKQSGSTGSYLDSNSYYSAAVRALIMHAEVYAVYQPSSTIFMALVADNTAQDSDSSTNVPGGWGDTEAAMAAAINGVDAIDPPSPTTGYDGTVTITTGSVVGATITWA